MAPTRIYTDEERKEKIKESKKKYREKNKEKLNEYHKKWYNENKGRNNIRIKKWRNENPNKVRVNNKKYREKNPEKEKESNKKYRSTENGIKLRRICKWKKRGIICKDFDSVYEIYIHTWICEWCLCEFKNTKDRHLDHNHETGEIRAILCRSCNLKDVFSNI